MGIRILNRVLGRSELLEGPSLIELQNTRGARWWTRLNLRNMGGSYSPPVPTALLKERSQLKASDRSQEISHESESFALQPPLWTVTFRVKRQSTLT